MNNQIQLPASFQNKFIQMNNELETLLKNAERDWTNPLAPSIKILIENSAPTNIISNESRAAFHNFILKFKDIPNVPEPDLLVEGERVTLVNLDLMKYIISEFRPIVFNKNDSIYFMNIHKIIFDMVRKDSPSQGTKLTILSSENDENITSQYELCLKQSKKVIERVIAQLDLDYLYNGIIQHSDLRFHEKYSQDIYSGELNYIILKNAFALDFLKKHLRSYYLATTPFWIKGGPIVGSM